MLLSATKRDIINLRSVRSQLSHSKFAKVLLKLWRTKELTQMKSLNPEYIVGLVDGEGSFTVYVRNPDIKHKGISRRVVVEPKFYLKLIERDKSLLIAMQEYFGCGNVYFQKDSRPNHQNCYRFEVFRRDVLENA